MADDLKSLIENMSNIMDGPISLTLIYDPQGKEQKLFIIDCKRLQSQG